MTPSPLTPSITTAVPARSDIPARYAGLDGLRAVAVILVLVYHLFPDTLAQNGFLGVDVFFVISGFLITSLLLRERRRDGRVSLRRFWLRRIRRLVPAVAVLIAVCSTAAWIVGGDVLVRLGSQIVGALTFSYNWIAIGTGSQYFSQNGSEVFRNLWSLSVEEQFYLAWPLLLPAVLLLRRPWQRVAVALGAAGASAGWMAAIIVGGGDLTRVYFGTDTHAFGLLLGVGLAFVLDRVHAIAPAQPGPRTLPAVIGALGIVGIVVTSALPSTLLAGERLLTFPGLLLTVSALTAIAVAGAAWPGSRLGGFLDAQPLRWIGERSYGIYLWHWPVLVLLVEAFERRGTAAGVPLPVGLLALATTVLAAAASFRFVEQPIRRLGFRGATTEVRAALRRGRGARLLAVSIVVAVAACGAGTVAAVVHGPERTASEAVVANGERALADTRRSNISRVGAALEPGTPPLAPTNDASPLPDPRAIAVPDVSGTQVTAVGDSVMLASAPGLLERMPGIDIDAEVSRAMRTAPGILTALDDRDQLRPFVVVGLGTNGSVEASELQDIVDAIGPDRDLVLVDASAPREWVPRVNETLEDFARTRPRVEVARWAEAIAPHPDYLAGDLIHPGPSGGRTYADVVARALRSFEERRVAYDDLFDLIGDDLARFTD